METTSTRIGEFLQQQSMVNSYYHYFNDSTCVNKPSDEHSIARQEISVQALCIQMSELSFIEKHQLLLIEESGLKKTPEHKNLGNNFQIPDICFFK